MNRDEEAHACLMRALAHRTELGDDAGAAAVLCSLGMCHVQRGKTSDAHDAYTQARDKVERSRGVTHPALLRPLVGLAGTLAAKGLLDDAAAELKRILALFAPPEASANRPDRNCSASSTSASGRDGISGDGGGGRGGAGTAPTLTRTAASLDLAGIASAYTALGALQRRLGALNDALDSFARALRAAEAEFGVDFVRRAKEEYAASSGTFLAPETAHDGGANKEKEKDKDKRGGSPGKKDKSSAAKAPAPPVPAERVTAGTLTLAQQLDALASYCIALRLGDLPASLASEEHLPTALLAVDEPHWANAAQYTITTVMDPSRTSTASALGALHPSSADAVPSGPAPAASAALGTMMDLSVVIGTGDLEFIEDETAASRASGKPVAAYLCRLDGFRVYMLSKLDGTDVDHVCLYTNALEIWLGARSSGKQGDYMLNAIKGKTMAPLRGRDYSLRLARLPIRGSGSVIFTYIYIYKYIITHTYLQINNDNL